MGISSFTAWLFRLFTSSLCKCGEPRCKAARRITETNTFKFCFIGENPFKCSSREGIGKMRNRFLFDCKSPAAPALFNVRTHYIILRAGFRCDAAWTNDRIPNPGPGYCRGNLSKFMLGIHKWLELIFDVIPGGDNIVGAVRATRFQFEQGDSSRKRMMSGRAISALPGMPHDDCATGAQALAAINGNLDTGRVCDLRAPAHSQWKADYAGIEHKLHGADTRAAFRAKINFMASASPARRKSRAP